jgi:hypothetical protein
MKISKIIVSCDDSHYQYFWPVVAQVCKKVLNIIPVLFMVGEEDRDFFHDGNGLVKYVKKIEGIPTSTQGQILRLYGTKFFPDEVCLLSDIDMILLNREYFIDKISEYSENSYVIFSSDGYDLERKECRDLFDFQVYPLCYHAAKGKIFSDLLEIDESFEDFANRVMNLEVPNKKAWYSDEIYLSLMINSKYDKYEFHKLRRGYQDNFYLPDRIEKYNFPVDFRANEQMRLDNIRLGSYDKQKLIDEYYIDCHCVRPYGWYDKEIWEVANTIINKKLNKMNDLIMVTAFCDTKEKEETLRRLVNQISTKKDKFDLMVVSHSVIPDDIIEKCDYHFYDKKNELLYDYDLRSKPWFAPNSGRKIFSAFTGFFNTHLAIWRMFILGNSIAKNCGYRKVHHVEYDSSIVSFDELVDNSNLLESYDTITYSKTEDNVDEILFGTYQAYRLDSLHEDLFILNEGKLKNDILTSETKSPEGMLFNLLHNKRNGLVKNKIELDKNGNQFGLSHHTLNTSHAAWCLPYHDRSTNKLSFIVWNMEGNEISSVVLLYNDEKTFKFENVDHGHWRTIDIDDFENAKKLTVILNNKIRNIFDFTKDPESFKQASYRIQ